MAKKKKRRRVNRGRIIALVVALILVLIACIFIIKGIVSGVKSLFGDDTPKDDQTVETDTKKKETKKKEVKLDEETQKRVEAYMDENPDLDEETAIKHVKMNLDLEPYEKTIYIEDDSDVDFLVNKFYALPDGYVPDNLVDLDSHACVQGEDYSCQDVAVIQLRKEAYDAYMEWCDAAEKEGLEIRAIAGYRSYEYQQNLWNYNASVNGEEYADQYYARPGQSEHNSGLCVDITFNGNDFNIIEECDGYDWILENAHKFGFILRYPEDKVDYTMYNYESWHFRYVGKEIATECYKNNWCLEEYWAEQ